MKDKYSWDIKDKHAWDIATTLILGLFFIGCILVIFFQFNLTLVKFTFVFLTTLICVEVGTRKIEKKWKAFWIKIGLIFVSLSIFGIFFGLTENQIATPFSYIFIFELLITLTKKSKKNKISCLGFNNRRKKRTPN